MNGPQTCGSARVGEEIDMTYDAPTLTTERLILRAHAPADLDACVHLWHEPLVTRYTTGRPLSRQEVWLRILHHAGHWRHLGFGSWAVTLREHPQTYLGQVGLLCALRDCMHEFPQLMHVPEANWVIHPAVHGQGYATEAMKAVHEWQAGQPGMAHTHCLIHPRNDASLNLARRLKFRLVGEAGEGDGLRLVLERLVYT